MMSTSCDIEGVQQCFNSIGRSHVQDNSLLFPYYEDSVLKRICNNYDKVQSCVNTSIAQCSLEERLKIAPKNEVLKYLCTTGYEGYKKCRSCLQQESLMEKVKECNSTYTSGVYELKLMADEPMNTKQQHLCKCMTDLITCVKDSTQQVCGSQASQWVYNMKTSMMSATMTQIECQPRHENQLPTILAVSFAVFVAMVVIGLAFLIIYKKVKSEENKGKEPSKNGKKVDGRCYRGRQSLEPLCKGGASGPASGTARENSEMVGSVAVEINENGSVVFKNCQYDNGTRANLPEVNESTKTGSDVSKSDF